MSMNFLIEANKAFYEHFGKSYMSFKECACLLPGSDLSYSDLFAETRSGGKSFRLAWFEECEKLSRSVDSSSVISEKEESFPSFIAVSSFVALLKEEDMYPDLVTLKKIIQTSLEDYYNGVRKETSLSLLKKASRSVTHYAYSQNVIRTFPKSPVN